MIVLFLTLNSISSTLVGQEIIQGKHIKEGGVTPEDYLHYIIACLCHDIGYVKNVCRHDKPHKNLYATGDGTNMIALPYGSTDAALT